MSATGNGPPNCIHGNTMKRSCPDCTVLKNEKELQHWFSQIEAAVVSIHKSGQLTMEQALDEVTLIVLVTYEPELFKEEE